MTELILIIPDSNKEIRVKADISDFATEEVLLMKCEDEKQKPTIYISKSLNEAEKKYEICDKEISVIIKYLEIQRYFLKGAKSQFEI